MNVVEELKDIILKLNEIDEYSKSLPKKRNMYDEKTQDLLHYIENNKLTTFECYRIVKELKDIRLKRRKVKNDIELLKSYNDNKAKLSSEDNRQFLLQSVFNTEKSLKTEYKNRQYSKEELEEIIK